MEKPPTAPDQAKDSTTIDSDRCVIHRDQQVAYFTMEASRPLKSRFVRINQPTLFARGRRATLNYGDFSKILKYLVVYEDVLIKELPAAPTASPTPMAEAPSAKAQPPSLRYGTGGRADFDSAKDLIILTEFPQVYQDNDTVTGDVIVVHRNTDVIEVEHSNSYSQGQGQ
jgi:hypothetical protein